MKSFTTVAVLMCVFMAMTSCMRQKFNHGMPRNNYDRPAPHKRFVKQHSPKVETPVLVVKAK